MSTIFQEIKEFIFKKGYDLVIIQDCDCVFLYTKEGIEDDIYIVESKNELGEVIEYYKTENCDKKEIKYFETIQAIKREIGYKELCDVGEINKEKWFDKVIYGNIKEKINNKKVTNKEILFLISIIKEKEIKERIEILPYECCGEIICY